MTAAFSSGDHEVRDIAPDVLARFLERWHYARGGSAVGVYRHGMYPVRDFDILEGVAQWVPPTRSAGAATYPPDPQGVLSLSRLAVRDDVPDNAESFLVRASMRRVDRSRWPCLLTYADTWRGHSGIIYRASGWLDAGLTPPTPVYVLDGRMVAVKSGARSRSHEELLEMGAVFHGKHPKHKYVCLPTFVVARGPELPARVACLDEGFLPRIALAGDNPRDVLWHARSLGAGQYGLYEVRDRLLVLVRTLEGGAAALPRFVVLRGKGSAYSPGASPDAVLGGDDKNALVRGQVAALPPGAYSLHEVRAGAEGELLLKHLVDIDVVP